MFGKKEREGSIIARLRRWAMKKKEFTLRELCTEFKRLGGTFLFGTRRRSNPYNVIIPMCTCNAFKVSKKHMQKNGREACDFNLETTWAYDEGMHRQNCPEDFRSNVLDMI